MRNLNVYLDDELSPLLAKEKNQNETVRKALRLYYSDISTSDREHMKRAFDGIRFRLTEIDGKVDYLSKQLKEVKDDMDTG